MSSAAVIAAQGTGDRPSAAARAFSRRRSCATRTLPADGASRVSRSRRSRLAAGTFSNSMVTASQAAPSVSSAAASS